ncbi:MAG: hypothetical protein WCM76_08290 [Bacteroidota bacterium]
MTKIRNKSVLKYKIKEKIDFFPHGEYVLAKRILPKLLGINPRTFEKYIYTKATEHYEMPAGHLAVLANFFNCLMEEMYNYPPKTRGIRDVSKMHTQDLASELGLIK